MSTLDGLIRLVTGDLTKEESRIMAQAGIRIIWRLWIVTFSFFAMGWFGFMGLSGFAKADEVDRKINAAAIPITVTLASITRKVDEQAAAAREQTLQLLRVAIVDAQVKKCHAGKSETAAIYRQMVLDAQEKYYQIAQQTYAAPACADL